jgi:hypothetical protein
MPSAAPSRAVLVSLLAAAVALLVPPAAASATTRLAGNVWTVDAENGRVTIVDAGRKLSFSYDDETIVRRGSSDRSVTELRRGDRIVVSLSDADPSRARLIAIAGPAAAGRAFQLLP